MNAVIYPVFANEIDEVVKELNRVICQTRHVQKNLPRHNLSYDDFELYMKNIQATFSWWCGNTYVGRHKDNSLSSAFQRFFEAIYDFLLFCKDSDISDLQALADKALYCGTLYRYLGYEYHEGFKSEHDDWVEPEYNNIYVSWSKLPVVPYIESKLESHITHLTCTATSAHYGIDLFGFGVGRPNEAEVVFPTLESAGIQIVRWVK